LAQPQWMGTRVPSYNPNVRGFLTGLTAKNCTPGHIFRSLLEGNSAVLADVIDIIEEVTGVSINEVRACGGGSGSDVQDQIIADMTGLEVLIPEASEAAVGSVLLAAWGSEKGCGIGQLASRILKLRKRYSPRADLKEEYFSQRERLKQVTKFIYGG